MKKELTVLEAFDVMKKFLEIYFVNTSSRDVAVLLSGMQMNQNNETFDPAAWQDWIECVARVLKEDGTLIKK